MTKPSAVRAALVALLLAVPLTARAQDPSHSYLTLTTTHFRVTFTRPLEPLARRVAANAERAYSQLSGELHAPRGTIDILVSDDNDFSNGSATPVPTNRIIVYATPPVSESALRFTTDWAQLVVTHELTHIFHLDRTRGIWRVGQYVFGRSPFLFPNSYSPSWLIEGLAVYEESRLAGEGRIEGPEHTLIARAAERDHVFPSIGQASLAYPRYPLGEAAYAYGSLFIDYLARTHGDSSIRKFVESSSAFFPDYLIDVSARRAFGTTFSHAWSDFEKATTAGLTTATEPMPGWRQLTTDGLSVNFPRWFGDSTLIYTGTGGRDAYGARTVGLDGKRDWLGLRNGESPTSRRPDGSLIFSQLDLTSPYSERSDLYVQRGNTQHRLTTNQRVFAPDVRADGSIVATQFVDGTSRLVRVSPDGSTVTPITNASFDTTWTEPRWSNSGLHIAAVRWIRGGISQIVIIDTLGHIERVVSSGKVVAATPAWVPGDSGVVFTIGHGATNEIALHHFGGLLSQPAESMRATTVTLSRGDFGMFDPQIARVGSSRMLAATLLSGDGLHLGVAPCCDAGAMPFSLPFDTTPDRRLPPLAIDTSPAKKYSAASTLLPRYWVPEFSDGTTRNGYRFGGYTEGWDILHRHYIWGEVMIPTDNSGTALSGEYQYSGLGTPVITLTASQDWFHYTDIVSAGATPTRLGEVRLRLREADALVTFTRPRIRTGFTFSLGAGLERREYASLPGNLFAGVNTTHQLDPVQFPRLTVSSTFAKYLSPSFSISPEDGFTLAVTARDRLRSGATANGGQTLSMVSALTAYKSIGLPGYAHHVLAVRAATGWADTKSNGYFLVGGTSGSTFQVVPGYSIGEGRQTFPVRGFMAGTIGGIRAIAGSVEYRAPLWMTHRTIGALPAFLQRTAITAFSDYGVAWCPNTVAHRQVCNEPSLERRVDISSAGAELTFNAGVLSWDTAYRFRLGFAVPLHNSVLASRAATFYLSSGISF